MPFESFEQRTGLCAPVLDERLQGRLDRLVYPFGVNHSPAGAAEILRIDPLRRPPAVSRRFACLDQAALFGDLRQQLVEPEGRDDTVADLLPRLGWSKKPACRGIDTEKRHLLWRIVVGACDGLVRLEGFCHHSSGGV